MDIREHCISSVFFHVIAVLLLAAFAQHQQRVPQSLTVSLSADTVGSTSKAAQPKGETVREVAKPALGTADEKRTVETAAETAEDPADAEASTGEKPAAVSDPEKAPEVPQTVATGPRQDAMRLATMHHVFAIHSRVFMEKTALSLQQALNKERESDLSGALRDGTAELTFFFDDEGRIGEVRGASTSETLMAVLERLDWRSVPSPGAYRIRMRGLHVMIKIDRGEPSFFFTTLQGPRRRPLIEAKVISRGEEIPLPGASPG